MSPPPGASSVRGLRRGSVLALLAVTLALPATAQQTPEPTLYELLPAGHPYPIARVCSTSEGICALPLFIPRGGSANVVDRTAAGSPASARTESDA